MWAMRSATCRRRTPPACEALVATYGYLHPEEDWQAWGGDGFVAQPLDLLGWLERSGRA